MKATHSDALIWFTAAAAAIMVVGLGVGAFARLRTKAAQALIHKWLTAIKRETILGSTTPLQHRRTLVHAAKMQDGCTTSAQEVVSRRNYMAPVSR